MEHRPVIPARVYTSNPEKLEKLLKEHPILRDAELPLEIAPAENSRNLGDFWNTMKGVWKPALELVVTLPVVLKAGVIEGALVTTLTTEHRQAGQPETAEVWIQIGGTVTDPNKRPVPGAWVRLETADDVPPQTTETNELGRFTFTRLRMGHYTLRVRAPGFAEVKREIGVPSPEGSYDVRLF